MLSIIIPTRNEERYLPKLLKSIKLQNIKKVGKLEIIVADANSTDKTKAIAKKYGCKVIMGGLPAFGRNTAAKKAKGNLLVFIDSDIILPKDKNFLSKCVEEFEHRKLDVAGTTQIPIGVGKPIKDWLYRIIYSIANRAMVSGQNGKKPSMQVCMFAKKKVHSLIGGFDETLNYREDTHYARTAVAKGKKFGILSVGSLFISPRRFEKGGIKYLFKVIFYIIASDFGHKFKIKDLGNNKKNYWDSE